MSSSSRKSSAIEWIKSILIAFLIAIFIKTFLFNSTQVKGSSMQPTLHENDRIFVNKIVYNISDPDYGDIITLDAPDKPKTEYIKRIIGLAGDRVIIEDGKVYLNGKELEESYIDPNSYTDTYGTSEWIVPQGEVFILGDNREFGASKDSRSLGTIDEDLIVGRAGIRYFPFDRLADLTDSK